MPRDDTPLLDVARRQYSLVAISQVRELGYSKSRAAHLRRSGRWELVTPRVIGLAGRRPDRRELLMAAVLDGGPGTFVGRRSAAALWRLPGYPLGVVETTRQKGVSGRQPSIGQLSTIRYLPPEHTTSVASIPVVALPVLLFHLAGFERPAREERALNTVVTKSPGVLASLHRLLPELSERGRNGITFMREWLEANPVGIRVVASGLEHRFQRLLAEAGEPPLSRQVDAGGHEWIGRIDFVDRELSALFEVDSQSHHASALDAAHDEDRDLRLLAAGWRSVTRIPEEWIWYEPSRAVAAVRGARQRLRRPQRRSGT